MIGDVVPVQAVGARLKIRRRINIAYSQRVEIRYDLARLPKCEPAIELQSVGAGWNAEMLLLCHAACGRDYTLNDEYRMTNCETNPNDETRNSSWPHHRHLILRALSFRRHSTFTSHQAPVGKRGRNRGGTTNLQKTEADN